MFYFLIKKWTAIIFYCANDSTNTV